jgi:S1-C subfamily serine protease
MGYLRGMKKFFIAALALAPVLAVGQGMWFPHEVAGRKADMKRTGMTMKADEVYSASGGGLNEAVVHFGGFCTGEVISSKGLVLTNHHCVEGCLQDLSSTRKDYLASGFQAKTEADEIKCPVLEVNQLVAITDVTARVQKATAGLEGP